MCNTLNIFKGVCANKDSWHNERVVVSQLLYHIKMPKRGDIVVIKLINGQSAIKRIIGLPGEEVIINNDGAVRIKNMGGQIEKLDETKYLSIENNNKTFLPYKGKDGIFKIPEDSYFLMGDNRTSSVDSRTCFHQDPNGCVISRENYYINRDSILGKAIFVFWPLSHVRLLEDL